MPAILTRKPPPMLATKLLLITDTLSARERAQQSLVKAAAAFPSSTLPAPSYLTVEEALSDSASLGGPTAAWLVLEDDADGDAEFAVTSRLHEKHLPVAVSSASCGHAGQEIEPGVVACPIDSEATLIAAILGALLAGGSVTQSLAQETRMLRAQSTGMAGQFDKIDEELRMALKIQREFLPKTLPSLDGLMFDVLWRPASYVGGDIYDVQRLDEHHIGVFIADAVGHGVPAALMTVYIKQAMVTRQITPGVGAGYRIVPPGEALAGLNRAMIEQDAGAASLGTAAYGVINTQTQRLTVARAGHPAPLLLRGNGETQWLEPDGAMLGIFPEEVFEELTFDLDDQDRLIIYSDGFEVAFPGSGKAGRLANTQYTEEFEGLRDGSGQEALDFLQGRLDLQSGSLNQRDDLTVVVTSVQAAAGVQARRDAADQCLARREVA